MCFMNILTNWYDITHQLILYVSFNTLAHRMLKYLYAWVMFNQHELRLSVNLIYF